MLVKNNDEIEYLIKKPYENQIKINNFLKYLITNNTEEFCDHTRVHDYTSFQNNILKLKKTTLFIDNFNFFQLNNKMHNFYQNNLLLSGVVPKKDNLICELKEKVSLKLKINKNNIDIIDFSYPFDNKNNFKVYIVLIRGNKSELNKIQDINYNKLLFNLNLLTCQKQFITLIPQYLLKVIADQDDNKKYIELPDFLNQEKTILDLTNHHGKLHFIKFVNKYNDDLSLYFIYFKFQDNQKSFTKNIMSKTDIINELTNI